MELKVDSLLLKMETTKKEPTPSKTSIEISVAELNRLCSKLVDKNLGRILKRLHDPLIKSPKTKENKDNALLVLDNAMKLLFCTQTQDRDILLELLPMIVLSHASIREKIFDAVLIDNKSAQE